LASHNWLDLSQYRCMKCLTRGRLDVYGLVVEKNRHCIHRAVGKLESCLGFVHGSLPLRELSI
jgi:hypothetical protein